jgi:phage gp29-like protein
MKVLANTLTLMIIWRILRIDKQTDANAVPTLLLDKRKETNLTTIVILIDRVSGLV